MLTGSVLYILKRNEKESIFVLCIAIQHSFRDLQLLLNASKTKCMLFNRLLPASAHQTGITTLDGLD